MEEHGNIAGALWSQSRLTDLVDVPNMFLVEDIEGSSVGG